MVCMTGIPYVQKIFFAQQTCTVNTGLFITYILYIVSAEFINSLYS